MHYVRIVYFMPSYVRNLHEYLKKETVCGKQCESDDKKKLYVQNIYCFMINILIYWGLWLLVMLASVAFFIHAFCFLRMSPQNIFIMSVKNTISYYIIHYRHTHTLTSIPSKNKPNDTHINRYQQNCIVYETLAAIYDKHIPSENVLN